MSYCGWKPYVSVAERRSKADKAVTKAKKTGAEMTPVPPYRGAIAKTFWGKSWCDNLECYSDYANRLPRGRTYVRNGSVIHLKITSGEVNAKVMGSSLYAVTIKVEQVPLQHWQALGADCSGAIDSLVELLQGKLSKAVMERICKKDTGLFPMAQHISFKCSCPDWASMCKHVAAVLYGIGARLDQQPELLFSLRGVEAKHLITQAAAGLPQGQGRPVSGKVLDNALLADIFDIEMAETPLPEKPAISRTKPSTDKKAAKKKTPVARPKTQAPSATTRTSVGQKTARGKVPAKSPSGARKTLPPAAKAAIAKAKPAAVKTKSKAVTQKAVGTTAKNKSVKKQ